MICGFLFGLKLSYVALKPQKYFLAGFMERKFKGTVNNKSTLWYHISLGNNHSHKIELWPQYCFVGTPVGCIIIYDWPIKNNKLQHLEYSSCIILSIDSIMDHNLDGSGYIFIASIQVAIFFITKEYGSIFFSLGHKITKHSIFLEG